MRFLQRPPWFAAAAYCDLMLRSLMAEKKLHRGTKRAEQLARGDYSCVEGCLALAWTIGGAP